MKIVITSPRAPIVIDWIKIMQRSGHTVTVVDCLHYPVASFCPGVRFIKIDQPKLEFEKYKKQILEIVEENDFTIPTCEDIFHLSKALGEGNLRKKVFIPTDQLLLGLHNKFTFAQYLNEFVKVPQTMIITKKEEIDFTKHTVLKPVFSRFGMEVVRDVTRENVANLNISDQNPWVQQEFVTGQALCNFAIIQNGKVITHVVYKPKYLVNNAASTYFETVESEVCNKFIEKFAEDNNYNGQVAFDFIENHTGLYIIECNPRGTSGLHLISSSVNFKNGTFENNGTKPDLAGRVGPSIYMMFGLQAILKGKLKELNNDFKKARDVVAGLPVRAQVLSFLELIYRVIFYKVSLTSASTFDIEYNGDN